MQKGGHVSPELEQEVRRISSRAHYIVPGSLVILVAVVTVFGIIVGIKESASLVALGGVGAVAGSAVAVAVSAAIIRRRVRRWPLAEARETLLAIRSADCSEASWVAEAVLRTLPTGGSEVVPSGASECSGQEVVAVELKR